MHLFGRLRAAQGNGEVFRTGGYGRHRRQWVNEYNNNDILYSVHNSISSPVLVTVELHEKHAHASKSIA